MIYIIALVAIPIVYTATVLFYIRSCFKPEGRIRFRECYLTMVVGFISELMLGGVFALTWQSDAIGYVVPPGSRIASFLGFTQIFAIAFSFMWLDLLRQYLKLPERRLPKETNVIKPTTQ